MICIAHTHACKEWALSTQNKNQTWICGFDLSLFRAIISLCIWFSLVLNSCSSHSCQQCTCMGQKTAEISFGWDQGSALTQSQQAKKKKWVNTIHHIFFTAVYNHKYNHLGSSCNLLLVIYYHDVFIWLLADWWHVLWYCDSFREASNTDVPPSPPKHQDQYPK